VGTLAKRSIVYIDGFNVYYGLLRGGKYKGCKWLNLEKLFTRLRPLDDLQRVKYFTAFWPDASGDRHKLYVQALASCPLVEVILGRFKNKWFKCGVERHLCALSGDQRGYRGWEEKETDVNIALHMLDDAYRSACDTMVLVSGDSNLIPALHLVRSRSPGTKIVLYVPGPHDRFRLASELRAVADDARSLPAGLLPACQFTNRVSLSGGASVEKPLSW